MVPRASYVSDPFISVDLCDVIILTKCCFEHLGEIFCSIFFEQPLLTSTVNACECTGQYHYPSEFTRFFSVDSLHAQLFRFPIKRIFLFKLAVSEEHNKDNSGSLQHENRFVWIIEPSVPYRFIGPTCLPFYPDNRRSPVLALLSKTSFLQDYSVLGYWKSFISYSSLSSVRIDFICCSFSPRIFL